MLYRIQSSACVLSAASMPVITQTVLVDIQAQAMSQHLTEPIYQSREGCILVHACFFVSLLSEEYSMGNTRFWAYLEAREQLLR